MNMSATNASRATSASLRRKTLSPNARNAAVAIRPSNSRPLPRGPTLHRPHRQATPPIARAPAAALPAPAAATDRLSTSLWRRLSTSVDSAHASSGRKASANEGSLLQSLSRAAVRLALRQTRLVRRFARPSLFSGFATHSAPRSSSFALGASEFALRCFRIGRRIFPER